MKQKKREIAIDDVRFLAPYIVLESRITSRHTHIHTQSEKYAEKV